MAKIFYRDYNFRKPAFEIIDQANAIVQEYSAQGFNLTLRQIYYQFIARDLLPDNKCYEWTGFKWVKSLSGTKNAPPNYSMLSKIISNARLAGLIDWSAIVDRTRRLNSIIHFSNVAEVLKAAKYSYKIDKWARQDYYIQVWIEKDALVGVISGVCNRWDISHIAVRGYNSQSTMHSMATMLKDASFDNKFPVVLHLGDHDPSGIDMTRDNRDRLKMFTYGSNVEVRRLALNYNQVKQYNPPPNPAKLSDSRAQDYVANYGSDSWELDALEPKVISDLIESEILDMVNKDIWNEDVEREDEGKERVKSYIQLELDK